MTLSLLLQLLSAPEQQRQVEDIKAVFTTSTALTLRRLSLLSIIESWFDSKIAIQALALESL